MADFYDLLGVSRDVDPDSLKRAYRRMARQYHPDINKDPGAEDRFKEIGRAYEVLSDPQTRACLLYTSPSPRDATLSRMPSSA